MERRGGADDGPIVLSVMAPRDGFDVQVPDGTLSSTQNDVLDAIFAEAIPRDNRNRLEIACVTIAPNAAKART